MTAEVTELIRHEYVGTCPDCGYNRMKVIVSEDGDWIVEVRCWGCGCPIEFVGVILD